MADSPTKDVPEDLADLLTRPAGKASATAAVAHLPGLVPEVLRILEHVGGAVNAIYGGIFTIQCFFLAPIILTIRAQWRQLLTLA